MQNWNQWQLPAASVTAAMPQPPIGYAPSGADPMATMQAYMQYYNQPNDVTQAPSGYTAEQWSTAQQQNWSQWQTWQQQYQQWQAQYGEKYQETMKQMSSQGLPNVAQLPSLPIVQPPPLPKEDTSTKPPLPPESSAYGYTGIPPPHQNNLPLFPSKSTGNPPLPPGQPPMSAENSNITSADGNANGKRGASSNVETGSAKKLKTDDEEFTEAEKRFDFEFKQWEEKFSKWKQQNASHPDKTQYKQYEAKWTAWREKLIERREQMRRKREQQKQTNAKAEAEKNKSMPGDDKILNILSSTENQGLINNLLGIGKTLGLTGKQEVSEPPSGQQPAQPAQSQAAEAVTPMGAPTMTPNMNQAAWAAQQWAAQYNEGTNMTNYAAGYQQSSVPPPGANNQQTPMPLMNFNQSSGNFNQPPGNFNQPPPLIPGEGPPNFSNNPPNSSAGGPNFALPPPGFGGSNAQQQSNSGQNQGQRPGQGNQQDSNTRSFRNDGDGRKGPPPGRDSVGNDRFGFDDNRFSGPPPNDLSSMNRSGHYGSNENFGRDGSNKDFGSGNQSFGSGSENARRDGPNRDFSPAGRSGNDFRSNDRLGNYGDRFSGSGFDRDQGGDRFGRDTNKQDDRGDNRFNTDRDSFNPDRFCSSNDRFNSGNDQSRMGGNRFGSSNDRFGSGNDHFGPPSGDRFGPGNEQFGASSGDRFSSVNDKFGTFSGDRFGSSNDRQGPSGDRMNQSNDRFGRPHSDRFESRDGSRDSFGSNSRGFGRSNQFDAPDTMAPELKKLMEKRKAAMDVFKPSTFGSFLYPDRNISTSSSLSESFRKITGDLPFARSFNDSGNKDSFGGRGPPVLQIGSSGNFDSARDCRPGDDRRTPDFQSRGGGDFNPRGSEDFRSRGDFHGPRGGSGDFSPRGSELSGGPRRLGDFPPRMGNDFGPSDNCMRNDFGQSSRNEQDSHQRDIFAPDKRTSNSDNSERMLRPHPMDVRKGEGENSKSQIPTESHSSSTQQNVPPLQEPPWMSANFADDDIMELPVTKSAEKAPSTDQSKNKPDNVDDEKCRDMSEEPAKKLDDLPFMGENDPVPEDLNMEPPPDLPNLGPVIKGLEQSFDQRENMGGPFGPPHSDDFNLRPPFDYPFGPRGMQMGPRGPMPFGLRGPDDSRFPPFGPRGMGGPADNMGRPQFFSPHASNIGPFGSSGPQEDRFNPRGPEIGPFGPRGPSDFNSRGPADFGPRGPCDFGPRGPGDFGPRDSNDGPFGPRGFNDRPFGPRGPLEGPFEPRGSNDNAFGPRPTFGSNAFPPRGNLDGPRPAIPSLMDFKLDEPPMLTNPNDMRSDDIDNFAGNRGQDLPPAFRGGDNDRRGFGGDEDQRGFGGDQDQRGFGGDQDQRGFGRDQDQRGFGRGQDQRGFGGDHDQRGFGGDNLEDRERMDLELCPRGQGPTDWRQPFMRNKFGDSDQRSGLGDNAAATPMGRPGGMDREMPASGDMGRNRSNFGSEDRMLDKVGPTMKSFEESDSNLMTRRPEKRPGGSRKAFCIEKQFNYNHGTGAPNEILTEHTPIKVIDYAHAPRVIVHDYVTPAQCFDYGHGRLKPNVIEHHIYPKKDFKNWVENEHNLRDYTNRMKVYESDLRMLNRRIAERDTGPWGQQMREPGWIQEEKRSFERDRRAAVHRNDRYRRDRETDDYRERDRESRERGRIERDREWERNKHREDRSQQRRSNSKDRTRERPEKIRKESNKENSKDDERSKGNVSGQDSSAKNSAESTTQDNSEQEIKDAEPAVSPMPAEQPKPVEMPKSLEPPKTMELPKTPNFTMVDDLLGLPGRQNRPPKIVVILRGPPGSGKSFVAKLIKDKEVEHGGSAPRILSIDDYFLTEKEVESTDDNGKKVKTKEMVYDYEEAMEQSYITSLVKAFKKNITDGFFNFIILDSINEKISDYEEMWSFAKTKGFRVYVCEMEMDTQICLKRNIHKRSEDEINRIVDYFEPTPGYHQKLDVTSLLQEDAIEEVHMEDSQDIQPSEAPTNDDSQDSQEEPSEAGIVSKWERMEAEDKLDRLDGLAKKKHETTPHTMEDFLQVPDYYNMEDTSGKKRVRWADLEERKEQEKMRAVGFVVGQTNWDRMMDPTKGGSALTRTKYI